MREAGENYHEESKGKHPDERQKGPPSMQICATMLSTETELKSALEMLAGMPV